MLSTKRILNKCLVMICGALLASAAQASNPTVNSMTLMPVANHNVVGTVVAAPYFADDAVLTSVLVTNTLSTDALMHVHVIDGEPGGTWGEQDFYCGITPNETTLFVFRNTKDGPRLEVECSDEVGIELDGAMVTAGLVDQQPGSVVDLSITGKRGILVITEVALFDTNTTVTTNNRFIADWTTLDLARGTAISAEALHFQAAAPITPPFWRNNMRGDGAIGFGIEVSAFPSVLGADFFAPTPGGEIATEILLLTLDGKEGVPPRQRVDGWVYNDDEIKSSWPAREWECMDHFALTDLDPNFVSTELCDDAPLGCVGHVVLNPATVSVDFSPHDTALAGFGDDNQVRQSAFDGYIIHRFNPGAAVLGVGGIANAGATVRILNRGTTTLMPLGNDQVVLDLR